MAHFLKKRGGGHTMYTYMYIQVLQERGQRGDELECENASWWR